MATKTGTQKPATTKATAKAAAQPKPSGKARVLVLGGGMGQQIAQAGGEMVYMGYTDPKAAKAAADPNIHALILTGGSDVSPRLYGQEPHPRTQSPNEARDLAEVTALQAAMKRGIPVLGVCRGAQMLNVAFGGTLHQHLDDLKHAHRYHLGHDHRVKLQVGTRLKRVLNVAEPWVVSIHHQAVDQVAPGFRVAARGLDGVIEAIEHETEWVIGVQFHPEIATNGTTQRVFNSLVSAAARKAGLPKPRRLSAGQAARLAPVRPKAKPMPKMTPEQAVARDKGWSENSPWVRERGKARTAASVNGTEPRLTAWTCFRCGVQFEERIDHVDHMWFLHGVDLLEGQPDSVVMSLLGE